MYRACIREEGCVWEIEHAQTLKKLTVIIIIIVPLLEVAEWGVWILFLINPITAWGDLVLFEDLFSILRIIAYFLQIRENGFGWYRLEADCPEGISVLSIFLLAIVPCSICSPRKPWGKTKLPNLFGISYLGLSWLLEDEIKCPKQCLAQGGWLNKT